MSAAERGRTPGRRLARALGWIAALLVLAAAPAAADSIFSALGVGEVVTTSDMRGRGMGNVSVGVFDPWNVGRGAALRNVSRSAEVVWGDGFAAGTAHQDQFAHGRNIGSFSVRL